MDKDSYIGIGLIIVVLLVVAFGTKSNFYTNPANKKSDPATLQEKISETRKEVEELENKIQTEKNKSEYGGLVNISSVNKSTNFSKEYITIRVSGNKTPILMTGWTLKSLSSGTSVTIPKGTYLYFTKTQNSEEDIYVNSGETLYIITGRSPIGFNFKTNKCSGYLGEFQTFTPNLKNNCPLPEDEDLSEIPNRLENDACFDHIDSMPRCRIQTKALPINWSYECKKFITEKINYSSCVDTHKNDKDFYQNEWRIYLKRDARLWKDRRETIVLYDSLGKVVDTIEY